MNVAVLTLTRDRMDYSRHCFRTLQELAGRDYDHFVLDQGSQDGTAEWLLGEDVTAVLLKQNIGICRGLNVLLDQLPRDYDVIVRFDNDCEVLQPDTLRIVSEVALAHEAIVAPRVLRLRYPPPVVSVTALDDYLLDETGILGGIFMAIPGSIFREHGFRYDESMPPYTGDEAIVDWWRRRGGRAGYLRGWSVNHYERVVEQEQHYPDYQQRKLAEMGR